MKVISLLHVRPRASAGEAAEDGTQHEAGALA